ncbi:hypothetical protein BMS3Abin04_00194 [bacterium BMS3Abin04]|nr:hypothetical protein BMS3Abin04_00194 [bacterium BMS3Abin04]
MKILIPNNIFCNLFIKSLNFFDEKEINILNASSIVSEVENKNYDLGIIPTLDLLNHHDLFVSSKLGISFSGSLSPAYFYFIPEQRSISSLFLQGDVSTNEIIISKILFKDRFNIDIEINLDTEKIEILKKNYLVVGDMNFNNKYLGKGLSLAEELVDQIGFPYVNFVVVSKDEKSILELNESASNYTVDNSDSLEELLRQLDFENDIKSFIYSNLSSMSFLLKEDDIEGINEILRLPYYHGIIEDITEIQLR